MLPLQSQSKPGSNGNKGVLCILQSSSITKASPSDSLVTYLGHSLGESYCSAEMQSVYSAAPADWVKEKDGWLIVTQLKLGAEGLWVSHFVKP